MYSDTSKFATGSALCQIQNGKPKLIAHASKRLPKATRNYSITGLPINIASFVHLLKGLDFDAKVDNLALIHIIKSKEETNYHQDKKVLEMLSSYSLNLYYLE